MLKPEGLIRQITSDLEQSSQEQMTKPVLGSALTVRVGMATASAVIPTRNRKLRRRVMETFLSGVRCNAACLLRGCARTAKRCCGCRRHTILGDAWDRPSREAPASRGPSRHGVRDGQPVEEGRL